MAPPVEERRAIVRAMLANSRARERSRPQRRRDAARYYTKKFGLTQKELEADRVARSGLRGVDAYNGGTLSGIGEFLLKNLDIGGRAVRGTLVGAGELVSGDWDFDDAADQFSGRAHTSDLLEDIGIDGVAGDVLGFVGDVATDPLTYLAPNPFTAGGAKGFAKHATTAGLKRVTAQKTAEKTAQMAARGGTEALEAGWETAAKQAAREAREELAEVLARSGPMGPKRRGLANLDEATLRKWLPEDASKYKFGLNWNVPTTGRFARAARIPWAQNGPKQFNLLGKRFTDPVSGRFSQATKALRMSAPGQAILNKIPGTTDEARDFAKLWEHGGDNAAAGIRGEVIETASRKTVAKVHQALLADYVENVRPLIRGNEHAVIAAIESGKTEGVKGAQEMAEWFKKAAKAADDAGVDINEIDDYFPRQVTDEIMVRKGINPTVHRELRKGKRLPDGTLITADTPAGVRAQADDYARRSGAKDGFFEKNPDKVIPTYLMSLRHRMVKGMTVKQLQAEGYIEDATRLAAKRLSKKQVKRADKLREALTTLRASHTTAKDKLRAEQALHAATKGKTEKQVAELLEEVDRSANIAATADDPYAVPRDLDDPQFDELLDPEVEQAMLDEVYPPAPKAKPRKSALERDPRYIPPEMHETVLADAASTAKSYEKHPAFVKNPNYRKTRSGVLEKRWILDPEKYPNAPKDLDLNGGKAWLRSRIAEYDKAVTDHTISSLPGAGRSRLPIQAEAAGAATRSQEAAGTIMPSVNKQRLADIEDALADPRHASDPNFVPEGFEAEFKGLDDLYEPKPPSKAEVASKRDEWIENEAMDIQLAAQANGKKVNSAAAYRRARAKAATKDKNGSWTFEDLNPNAAPTVRPTTKQRLEQMREIEAGKQARINAAQAHRGGAGGLHAVDRPMDMGPTTAAMNVEHGGDFGIAAEGRFGLGNERYAPGSASTGLGGEVGPLPDDFVVGSYDENVAAFYMNPTGADGKPLLDANDIPYEGMSRESAVRQAQLRAEQEARLSLRPGYDPASSPKLEEIQRWLPVSERAAGGYDDAMRKFRNGDEAGAIADLMLLLEDMHKGSVKFTPEEASVFLSTADNPWMMDDVVGKQAKRRTHGAAVIHEKNPGGVSDAASTAKGRAHLRAEAWGEIKRDFDPKFKPNPVGGKQTTHVGSAAGPEVDDLLRQSTQAREEAIKLTEEANRIRYTMPTRTEDFPVRQLTLEEQTKMLELRAQAQDRHLIAYDLWKKASDIAESKGFTVSQPRSLRGTTLASARPETGNFAKGSMERAVADPNLVPLTRQERMRLRKIADEGEGPEALEARLKLIKDDNLAAPQGYTGNYDRYAHGDTETTQALDELEAMIDQAAEQFGVPARSLIHIERNATQGNAALMKRAQVIPHIENGQETGMYVIAALDDDDVLHILSEPLRNTPSPVAAEQGGIDALNNLNMPGHRERVFGPQNRLEGMGDITAQRTSARGVQPSRAAGAVESPSLRDVDMEIIPPPADGPWQGRGTKVKYTSKTTGEEVPHSAVRTGIDPGQTPVEGYGVPPTAQERAFRLAAGSREAQIEREAIMAGMGAADARLQALKYHARQQSGTRITVKMGKIVEKSHKRAERVAQAWDEAAEEYVARETAAAWQAEKANQMKTMWVGEGPSLPPPAGALPSLPDVTGVAPRTTASLDSVLPTGVQNPFPARLAAGADDYQKALNDFTDGWSAWKAARDHEFRVATLKAQLKRNEELKGHLEAVLKSPDGVNPEFAARLERQIYHETRAAELMKRAGAEEDIGMRQVAYLEAQAARAQSAVTELDNEIADVVGNLKDMSKVERVAVDELKKGIKRSFADINRPDLMADPDLVDAIVGVNRVSQAGGMKEFFNHYDRLLNFTKAWHIASPGFHFRNFMGGAFNNYLAGMDFGAYRRYIATRKAWRIATKDGAEELTQTALARIPANQRKLVGYFDQLQPHIAPAQYSSMEVAHGLSNRRALSAMNPFGTEFKWLTANQKMGGKVEEMLRGTLGLDRLVNGKSLEAAFDDIYKFHFDYEALSAFERKYVKRVIPFYTWTRKNFPLQLEMMVRKPGKYLPYVAAQNNFAGEAQGDTPTWFGDLWATPLNMTAGQLPFGLGGLSPSPTDQLFITPDLPFTRTMTDPLPYDSEGLNLTKPLNMVAAPLKIFPELMMGRKVFGDLPIKGQRRVINSGGANGLGMIPGLVELLSESGLAKKDRKTGEISVEEKVAHMLETAMPPLSVVQRLNPASKTRQDAALASVFGFLGLPVRANTERLQKSTKLAKKFAKADAKAKKKLERQFVKP